MSETEQFISLGGSWDGRDEQSSDDVKISRGIDYLLPLSVPDEAMACGGRSVLEATIGRRLAALRPCGECAVREVCALSPYVKG